MKLHHGMTVVIRLDGEEMHLRLTANPAGPGELNLRAPLVLLLRSMSLGDTCQSWTPRSGGSSMRVEFVDVITRD